MHLSPDEVVLWQAGACKINSTIATTWLLMALLSAGSWLITRRLSQDIQRSRWQNLLEMIVSAIQQQIAEVGLADARRYLPFLGSLLLFVAFANLCTILPLYEPPTSSLSTTTALALSVFIAVPWYAIRAQGLGHFLKTYIDPTPIMLPFNLIGEVSRTLALAVRLFGNMMSGAMIIAILLAITPLLFPLVMTALGLLTGMVQAYIFFVLATVYLAAAMQQETPPAGTSPAITTEPQQ